MIVRTLWSVSFWASCQHRQTILLMAGTFRNWETSNIFGFVFSREHHCISAFKTMKGQSKSKYTGKVLTDLSLSPIYKITFFKNDIRITSISSAGRVPLLSPWDFVDLVFSVVDMLLKKNIYCPYDSSSTSHSRTQRDHSISWAALFHWSHGHCLDSLSLWTWDATVPGATARPLPVWRRK